MSKISKYSENNNKLFKVTVGRKTFRGFKSPDDAFRAGITEACNQDPRASQLINGKPFERQVAIVFGADVHEQYFGS